MPTSGSDLHEHDGWPDYCHAARRKIDIAEYHLECLRAQASQGRLQPTIPVQAHLEGILFAFVAATDQMAEAINLGMELQLKNPNLRTALKKMPPVPIQGQLTRWHDAAIAADIHDLRVRATHHHYVKMPGGPSLEVQKPARTRPYGGSRTLVAYGDAAIAHLRLLRELLDSLQQRLNSPS